MNRIARSAATLLLGLIATCLVTQNVHAQGNRPGLLSDPTGRVIINQSVVTETGPSGSRRVPFGARYRLWSEYGDGWGWNSDGQTYVGAFVPFHLDPFTDLIFVDGRFYTAYQSAGDRGLDNKLGGNIGVGYRRVLNPDVIVGGSVWFDIDHAQEQHWMRYGASGEVIINGLELRLNATKIEGDGTQDVYTVTNPGDPFFSGNFIVRSQTRVADHAFDTVDGEVGGLVPFLESAGIYAYGGGYWMYNADADISRFGVKLRAEMYLHEDIQIGVEARRDDVFDTSVWGSISVQLPREGFRQWWQRFLAPRGTKQHLSRQVERHYRVPVARMTHNLRTPLRDPKDGLPIFVLHVNPNGPGGGIGTFERPFNSGNFANSSRADIIRVLPGQFTSSGTVTLFDCQRLLGANHMHLVHSTAGSFTLPGQVVGGNPRITNLLGGDVVRLADNTEVSGFDINGGGTGIGILGKGVKDININRVNITDATDGIRLEGFSQTGAIVPFGRPNTIEDVTIFGSKMQGIRLLQEDGSSAVISINRVTSRSNELDGILVDLDMGSSLFATIRNSDLSGNRRNALRYVMAGGSTGDIMASDINASDSGEHGVFVSATGSTMLPSTFTRITANNNGRDLTPLFRDGFNFDFTGSTGNVTVSQSTARNLGFNVSQQNGVRTRIDGVSTFALTLQDSNFSGNAISAINSIVRDTGTLSVLTVARVIGNSSGRDGFFYDVTGGKFLSTVSSSSFNMSGRNGVRAIGGTTPADMRVTFDSTTVNGSGAEGILFSIDGLGGPSVFEFTYLPTAPSAVLGSGGATGYKGTFMTAGLVGFVKFNGITIDGGTSHSEVGGAVVPLFP